MNQKQIGIALIVVAIVLAFFVYFAKAREDKAIEMFIHEEGTCYLSDGTCLHEDRNYTLYIVGWIISGALFLFAIYLTFDKTQSILALHQEKVATALKEASKKDEFAAFLEGFNDDEKNILKNIKAQDGIQQSTLRYKTGLSKTKLSLILKNLEERKMVSRKPEGKTNKVYLRKF